MNKNESHAGNVGFPRVFWIANSVELLERAAYYGVFIVITLYLSRILGFNDVQAAWISGGFASIALVSAISLIIYGKVVRYLDKKNALAAPLKAELVADVS